MVDFISIRGGPGKRREIRPRFEDKSEELKVSCPGVELSSFGDALSLYCGAQSRLAGASNQAALTAGQTPKSHHVPVFVKEGKRQHRRKCKYARASMKITS